MPISVAVIYSGYRIFKFFKRLEKIFNEKKEWRKSMSMTNYIIVMKALEDGKFLITFPDFEGLTATADSEESIQSVATETIKTKLAELKKDNLVIPEAKKNEGCIFNFKRRGVYYLYSCKRRV